jgi:molecular chaperone DnaK (HSP70)
LRTREETDWKRNNPETKARANDMTQQLTSAIQKLEDELEAAKKSGDKKAIASATDALEARRSWLKALGG